MRTASKVLGLAPITILTLLAAGAAVIGLRSPEGEQYRPDPRWTEAQRRLVDANSGRFELELLCTDSTAEAGCDAGRPRFFHFGSFSIDPIEVDYYQFAPYSMIDIHVRTRRLSDGRTFELLSHTGQKPCWFQLPPGVSMDADDYGSDLPAGVRVLLETKVESSGNSPTSRDLVGTAPLELVARLFLVPRILLPELENSPPVRVDLRLAPNGDPARVEISGADVKLAFANLEVEVPSGVVEHDARFVVNNLRTRAVIEAPSQDEIRATKFSRGTCTEAPVERAP